MSEFLIGRQQIFDRKLNVVAYELLFRDSSGKAVIVGDGSEASKQVIVDSVLNYGLERIVGKHRAFINFTAQNLLDGVPSLLPNTQIVIEVLENVKVSPDLVEMVRHYKDSGFTIALDDFVYSDEWLPLIKIADIIKIDVLAMEKQEIIDLLKCLKPYSVKYLAEKVETKEDFTFFRDIGCDYFQGYFFSEPNIVRGSRLEATSQNMMQLLAEINKKEISIKELAQVISSDVGLTYKILRYINSAFFALPKKIESIQHAIVLLGPTEVKRWASLLTLSNFPGHLKEYMHIALTRAKMCELLAPKFNGQNSDQFFLVGLMSTLDKLLETTQDHVIEGLPLSDEVIKALESKGGPSGRALQCTIDYEQWNLSAATGSDINISDISDAFLESIAWANEMSSKMDGL